jgi:hypothetical protein
MTFIPYDPELARLVCGLVLVGAICLGLMVLVALVIVLRRLRGGDLRQNLTSPVEPLLGRWNEEKDERRV